MTGHDQETESAVLAPEWDLRHFLLGRDATPEWLLAAIPDAAFYWPSGLSHGDRLALCYRRCGDVGRAAPPAGDLVRKPSALAALMARLAVADPVMFHICLVHYTLVLAPIVESDPDGRREGLREICASLETMQSFGAALMTETARSSSHLQLRTRATFDPNSGDFILHTPDADAAKFPNNTANPAVSKTAAVYAQLVSGGQERGIFVFIVPLRTPDGKLLPGVDLTPAPDTFALAADYASVRFDHMRIPFHTWLPNGAMLEADGRFHDPAGSADARRARTMSTGAPLVWRSVIAASASVAQGAVQLLQSHTAVRLSMGRLAPEQPLIRCWTILQEALLGNIAAAYVLAIIDRHATGTPQAAPSPPASEATWAPWSAVDRDLPLLERQWRPDCAPKSSPVAEHTAARTGSPHTIGSTHFRAGRTRTSPLAATTI